MTEAMKLERRAREWDKSTCYHAIMQSTMKVEMAAGVSWRHQDADPMVEVRRCMYCHAFLPIEPSKDTTESEIELAAVEITLMTDEEQDAKLGIMQKFALGEGFCDSEPDFPDTSDYNSGEWAAWLAAQIIQHEIKGNPT